MTDPNHTDTSRSGDLVQNLRDMPVWPMEEAADRIEAQAARIANLEAVLRYIIRYHGEPHLVSEICRAALGDTQ